MIRFNQGNALARKFDVEAAVEHYTSAAETEDAELASQVHYIFGVVKNRHALDALQTFQDAMSYSQAAIRLWRESLELKPSQEDVRYNLQPARRLFGEIEAQRIRAA